MTLSFSSNLHRTLGTLLTSSATTILPFLPSPLYDYVYTTTQDTPHILLRPGELGGDRGGETRAGPRIPRDQRREAAGAGGDGGGDYVQPFMGGNLGRGLEDRLDGQDDGGRVVFRWDGRIHV